MPALAFVLLSAIATPSWAQASKSIDPGMSEAKVVERLGQPDASRTSGDFKYLFYHNNCIKQCGMDDVVILQKDSVVDAMFRSADRSYTGKSSSPLAFPPRLRRAPVAAPTTTHPCEVVRRARQKPTPRLPLRRSPDSAKKPAAAPKHSTKKTIIKRANNEPGYRAAR